MNKLVSVSAASSFDSEGSWETLEASSEGEVRDRAYSPDSIDSDYDETHGLVFQFDDL